MTTNDAGGIMTAKRYSAERNDLMTKRLIDNEENQNNTRRGSAMVPLTWNGRGFPRLRKASAILSLSGGRSIISASI